MVEGSPGPAISLMDLHLPRGPHLSPVPRLGSPGVWLGPGSPKLRSGHSRVSRRVLAKAGVKMKGRKISKKRLESGQQATTTQWQDGRQLKAKDFHAKVREIYEEMRYVQRAEQTAPNVSAHFSLRCFDVTLARKALGSLAKTPQGFSPNRWREKCGAPEHSFVPLIFVGS